MARMDRQEKTPPAGTAWNRRDGSRSSGRFLGRRPFRGGFRCALLAAVLLAAPACETSVDPFVESDRYFSVFGYLDAGADTQFVRVSPLRRGVPVSPDPLDAVVTLEHLATGRTVTLRDSVFTYGGGRRAHNFWTAEPILPGATYRLTVGRSDGAASTATVSVPPAPPDVGLDTGRSIGVANPPAQVITIDGIAAVADVQVRYVLADGTSRLAVSYLPAVNRFASGRFVATGNLYEDLRQRTSGACPAVAAAEVFVAAAEPGWPDFLALSDEELVLPDAFGNVEGGLGFVGGIYGRRVPWPGLAGLFGAKQGWCERGCLNRLSGC